MKLHRLILAALGVAAETKVLDTWNSGASVRAKVTADCLGSRKVAPRPVETDLVIALDTSFCNSNRIDQVKTNLLDLIGTITTPENGGQKLGDSLRVSVVSFNRDAREIFSFSKYNRLDNIQMELEKAVDQIIFDDETTNYNAAFERIETIYSSQFRENSQRAMVIYSNGNQNDEIDYNRLRNNLDNLELKVFGMSFSSKCPGNPTDDSNLDRVCPNRVFFQKLTDDAGFIESNEHSTAMEITRRLFKQEDDVSDDFITDRECETGFPYIHLDGDQGEVGPPGTDGDDGRPGEPGAPGEDGEAGRPGENGPTGFAGPQGDRGEPGRHGEPGVQGPRGPQGNRGETGPRGPPGNRGRDEVGPRGPEGPAGRSGQDGVRGSRGKDGARGRDGERGPDGRNGDPGNPGRDGPDGDAGSDGLKPTCDESSAAGDRGAPGIPGNPGKRGEDGQNGENGEDGQRGPAGARGPTGERGRPGPSGEAGPQGKTGKAGENGPDGVAGDPGLPGPDGDQGNRGPSGEAGIAGDAGPTGLDGKNGNPGEQGDIGECGPAGKSIDGCQGPPGLPGPQGPAGSDGDAGRPGPDGASGCPGPRGAPGNPGSPGVIEQDELEILVHMAIKELIEECEDDSDSSSGRGDIAELI
ncbi:Oidioi.mRNA.OKI2018_I69.XSR.g15394.t1.cds [Oikopleura dioica]|uniref:Oidioi.mRNA.OKI2018_I69.XSR.g15394.t1.cds n=1 Tax=Oikopleura dioica TaxID=34765 RepID=A0ABN7SCR2_OIKDI|nr:Oidioi.mRNA.OKI2018_I69.XSR.g15394.t1.cds [Oikopleura dioica]